MKEEEEDTNVWDTPSPPSGTPEDTNIQVKEESVDIKLWDVDSPPPEESQRPMLDGEEILITTQSGRIVGSWR